MEGAFRNRIFVSDTYCISPQQTFDQAFFETPAVIHTGNRYISREPSYGNLIPAGQLRRMGKAVRMGVGAGLPLIVRNEGIEGIVLGTANGGLEDCLKFLNQIVDFNEGTLTPTNFVQSTPNAVAGSLALASKNTGYNTTHVNKGLAFEGALLDVLLNLWDGTAKKMLLGNVEEISEYNYNIDFLAGSFKNEEITSDKLLSSDTPGTVCGEGAAMFVLTTASEAALAEVLDVDQILYPDRASLTEKLQQLLVRNGLSIAEIDTLVLGNSGDSRSDFWFDEIQKSVFPESNVFTYKNLVGDYPTSSAFAMWMGTHILQGKAIPGQTYAEGGAPRNLLIYNHFKGDQHGFILLRSVNI